jgi:hypothetical protein
VAEDATINRFLGLVRRVHDGSTARSENDLSSRPRVVITMHYHSPRGVLDIEPVDVFLARHPADSITRVGGGR